MKQDNKIKIEYVAIDKLKQAEYNPRKATDKEYQDVRESIKKFGFGDAILVNSNKSRENIIIAGHLRVTIAKKMGFTEVPVIYHDLSAEDEKELNLRMNKNTGGWDWDKLAQEDVELLKKVGFEQKDLDKLSGKGEKVVGDESFNTEIYEENNYVLFVFDNVMDWQFIKENLPVVEVTDMRGESKGRGTGRVFKGQKLIQLLKNGL